jgi:outer membrane protein OmpA-like peptidoglycan-associated protein
VLATKAMKNLILLQVFIAILSQNIFAQPILLRDDFDKDDGSWSIKNDASTHFRIENGFYILEDKDTTQRWYCWKDINYFSHKLDFEIEAKIRLRSGSLTGKFGIAWGLADLDNLNTFGINGDASFFVQSKVDKTYKNELALTKAKSIKGIGSLNLLKIKSIGQKIYYYVNDSLVYSAIKPDIKGANIGFLVDKNSTVEVDYIQIRQESKMNLVDNPVLGRKSRPIEKINTSASENTPLISADGQTLYFSRESHPKNIGDIDKADCWYSKKDNNGWFTEPVNMGKPLNNEGHNFIIYVSPDEHTLILANRYDKNGEPNGQGLSISHLTDKGWTIPEDITIEGYKNEAKYVEYYFLSNRKVLISSIKNENSIGDIDLFVSFQIDEKTYTKPVDMGSVLNSLHSETFPVLSADGKKLYFSSNGHPGYGHYDIFVSERKDDSWLNWSTPKNLGPEINTASSEMGFQLNQKGDLAYFTSNKISGNKLDIFEFYTEEKKQDSLCLFTGEISDAQTGKPLAAEITFYTTPKHKEVLLSKSNPNDGSFKGTLPTQINYDFYGIKKGYYSVTSRVYFDSKKDSVITYKITMKMYPVQEGLVVPMPNLAFTDKNLPTEYSTYELDRLLHLMEEYPALTIQLKSPSTAAVQGFTQAESLKNYLISKGIKPNRFLKAEQSKNNNFEFKIVAVQQQEIKEQVQYSFSNQIKVTDIKKGQKFKVENLYFMADSTSFTVASQNALQELASFLIENKNLKVEIGGHTNGLPAHEYCDKLSNDRAKSVLLFLVRKGVNEKMLSFKGYGKREALDDNGTESGRARNQRVEIKILDIL